MFEVTKKIKQMLEKGYQDLLKHCCPCVIDVIKNYDEILFSSGTLDLQIFAAKISAEMIEACSRYNADRTKDEDGIPEEKISCAVLFEHYIKKSAQADFRRRWNIMYDEITRSELNIISTKERFETAEPSFIELYLNYRLGEAICTFGERHKEAFIFPTERDDDTKLIKAALATVMEEHAK
jgi:hypothetical protein